MHHKTRHIKFNDKSIINFFKKPFLPAADADLFTQNLPKSHLIRVATVRRWYSQGNYYHS